MKGRNNNNKVPTFDDIDNIDDDLEHIGEVYPNDEPLYEHKDDDHKLDQISSIKQHQSKDDKTDRSIRRRHDDKCLIDPTISHVKRGMILLPVNMTLPTHYGTKEKISKDSNAPTYSIDQSRISLFTSFPPPPTIVQPRSLEGYSDEDLKQAKQRLKQHLGYYLAAGVTSATKHDEGYSDSILSMNYRIPTLISWPPLISGYNSKRHQYLVSDMHYNLHVGSSTKAFVGTTLQTLDGKTHLRFDMGNPFYNISSSTQNGGRVRRMQKNTSSMITSPSLQSDYIISASHDFNNSLHANWLMKIAPSPPLIFSPTNISSSSTSPIHMQHMNLTLSNMTGMSNRLLPKLTLTLGYGMPLTGGEALWMSNIKPGRGEEEPITHHNCIGNKSSVSSVYSSNVKLEIEQDVSSTQTGHSTVEYCHTDQLFSLGTIFTRTFLSSRYARLGVGMRHTFGNIFENSEWWKQGTTSWLFQLERGDVRLLIPVTIYPIATTAWDSLVRIIYVSLTSIVVDIIVSELLCGVTSTLRLRFLKILLGKELVDKNSSSPNFEIEKEQEEKENWLQQQHQLVKVQEHTARQVNLMKKQARVATKREEDQGGLVIIKAIYGVMDNTSRQWIQYRDTKSDMMMNHTMKATTQLQFWVTNSSLHLPAVSKKHMLGFYDLLAFVSDDEWEIQHTIQKESNTRNSLFGWWKEELVGTKQNRRDLAVVLSIQYKWNNKLYQVMYHDDEAVDLPSQHAEEVVE